MVKKISESDRKKLTFLGLLGIFFLGFLVYSNILHAPFVFDDFSSIVDNERVKNVKTALSDVSNRRYVTFLSFALNYAAGGVKPFGYHLVNNLIHVCNALLVYWLILLTFRTPAMKNAGVSGKFIAFSSAFIFVSHPIQTQAVTYVAQRFTSMAAFFYLLALVMYIGSRLKTTEMPGKKTIKDQAISLTLLGVAAVSAGFAMKSKEIAFTLPFIAMLYEISFLSENSGHDKSGRALKRFLYLAPILLTMLIIPFSMMDFTTRGETLVEQIEDQSKQTLNINRTDYLLTEFRVVVTYLRLLVFPVKQSIDYNYPVFRSLMQPQVFLSFLLLFSIFSLGIYLFFRSRFSSRGLRLVAFGIFWFFITLSVESTIIPIRDVIFEHRLYLPSVGFFIALITSIEYFIREPKAKIGLVIVCVAILSASTFSRNKVWQDPQTLWEDVLHKFPANVRAYNALGVIYKNESDYDKAAEQFEKILTINPGYPPAYYNLGDIRLSLGDYEGAIRYFKKTLTLKLNYNFHLDTLNSLGIAYSEMGDSEKAVATFKEAIKSFPQVISPYNNLGRQYIKMGEADLAIQVLEKGLQIRETPHLYYNLARAYDLKNDKAKSELMKQKARTLMN